MILFITVLHILSSMFVVWQVDVSYAQEVAFTKEDRERLRNVELKVERLEVEVREGLKAVNQRIDDLKTEVNSLKELIYVGIGGIFILIGFVLWDRRTALQPAE